MLVDRFQAQLKSMRSQNRAGRKTAVRQLKAFLAEQEKFLSHMNQEILPYEDVTLGLLPEEDIPTDAPPTPTKGFATPPDDEAISKRLRTE